jgi:hypothetical protein
MPSVQILQDAMMPPLSGPGATAAMEQPLSGTGTITASIPQ